MLSRGAAFGGLFGSSNQVYAVKRARPSSFVERRIFEYNPPVRRRFLDHPLVRRWISFSQGSPFLDLERAGRRGDLLLFIGTHARECRCGDA
jgi:hypothetical protein